MYFNTNSAIYILVYIPTLFFIAFSKRRDYDKNKTDY